MNSNDERGIIWDTGSGTDLGVENAGDARNEVSGLTGDRANPAGLRGSGQMPSEPSADVNIAGITTPEPKDSSMPEKDTGPPLTDTSGKSSEDVPDSETRETALSMDAGTVMRYALDHLTKIFGEKWAEKAAARELRLRKLNDKIRALERDLSTANEQVKNRDKEIRQLRLHIRGMQTEKAALEDRKMELTNQVAELRAQATQWENHCHQTELSARNKLMNSVEQAFGTNSELYRCIDQLSAPSAEALGYACVFSLPETGQQEGQEGSIVSVHSLVTMANKFLRNVRNFDGPERTQLLNIVADHLSRASQLFTFRNEEGQLFNPDRHSVRSGQAPSPGAKVSRIMSFYVGNNKTRQPLHKAEVLL